MKKHAPVSAKTPLCILLAAGVIGGFMYAADDAKSPIKEVMKTYHKAPQGTDPICKKASEGTASTDELKKLVAAYTTLAAAKPPKGDDASWKDKTTKLLTAAKSLQKGEAGAALKYKEAVNCKACHTIHKPD